MNSRFRKLAVESLEGHTVLSATAFADFNHDGLLDVAAITDPTTITVSLANRDGSYTISATLTAPKNQPVGSVYLDDYNGDGQLDISGGGFTGNRFFNHIWLGDGDGTFGKRATQRSNPIPPWGGW